MKTLLRVAILVAAGLLLPAQSLPPASVSPWQADLAFLRAKLIAMHPNPFRKIGASSFNAEADRLNQRLAGASREQAIVGIMRLVASLGDGHTSVLPGPQVRAGFHVLPLRFYLYGSDLILDGADRAYAAGLGGRLTAINGMPAQEVIRRVRQVTPGDNRSSVDGRLPSYVVVPEVLAGIGAISAGEPSVPVTLAIGGQDLTLAVAPIKSPEAHAPPGITTSYTANWVDRAPKRSAMWLRSSDPYWFSYNAKSGTLYLQYSSCTSNETDPMPKFANRLKQQIARRQPSRVVVDLRLNSGGEGYWTRFLVRALMRAGSAIDRQRFFVLIGRQTFSAGNMMAIELEKYAAATFAGEPSGGSVQGFGNHEPVFLPNSGLGVMIATKFYQNNGPNDDRAAIKPQIAVSLSPADYASGRDPVLEAVLRARD